MKSGKIAQIVGPVIDVEFESDSVYLNNLPIVSVNDVFDFLSFRLSHLKISFSKYRSRPLRKNC